MCSEGVRAVPPRSTLLWCVGYFEVKALGQQQVRGKTFSKLPSCLMAGPPKEFNCRKPLCWGVSSARKTGPYHKEGDWQLTPYPDKLRHKLSHLPSVLPRAHSPFTKIIYSHLCDFHRSPAAMKTEYMLSNIIGLREFIFSLLCLRTHNTKR